MIKFFGVVLVIDAAVSLWVVNEHWMLNGFGKKKTQLFFMDLGRFIRLIIGMLLLL